MKPHWGIVYLDAICDWLVMSVMDSGLKVTQLRLSLPLNCNLSCHSGPYDPGSSTAYILLLCKVESLPSANLKLLQMDIVLFHLI